MAQETGTLSTYDVGSAGGNKESVLDKIFDITPTDCVVTKLIGTGAKPKGTKHEWFIDELAAAVDDNAVPEGDEYSFAAPTPPSKVANYCQIMRKSVKVTGSQQASEQYGRADELAHQTRKKAKELKLDLEKNICSNIASVAGTDGAPTRKMASFSSFLETNTSAGASGADGGYNSGTGLVAARTDGTQRALTKTLIDAVIKDCFDNGGDPTTLIAPSKQRAVISGLISSTDTVALQTNVNAKGSVGLISAVDFYKNDLGRLAIKTGRHMRDRDVFLIDPTHAHLSYLRKPKRTKAAVTGDNENYVIIQEVTLVVTNEAAHGGIFDLT